MRRLAVLVLAPLMGACSGAPATTPTSASSPTPSVTSATPAPSRTPIPTALPTSALLEFGQEGATKAATFVISESKVIDPESRHLQVFMLRACMRATETEANAFTSSLWMAVGPDGERYQPSDWSDVQPGYHFEMPVQPGECVKGWLQFETRETLVEVRYQNDAGERVAYRVPES